jgi:hypothetical protein
MPAAAAAPRVAWPATAPEWSFPVAAALRQVDGLMDDSKRIYESVWRMFTAQPNLPLLSNSGLENLACSVQAAALRIASGVQSHVSLGLDMIAVFLALLSGGTPQPAHRQLIIDAVCSALEPVVG